MSSKKVPTNDAAANVITVPAGRLVASPRNARNGQPLNMIPELAATIESMGLLQNIVVTQDENGDYPVEAGRRRAAAVALLIEQGKWTPEHPVLVKLIPVEDAISASAIENSQREEMHPADEFEAFRRLAHEEKRTIDWIADTFGVSPLVVERRLKLTAAAPELLAEYREDELSTDQMLALCTTDDHAVQLEVWNARRYQNWNNDPADLRTAVLRREVSTTDKRVAFIGGLAAYEQAGGAVRRDLFSEDGNGQFIADVPLLDKLVFAKIDAEAENYEAAGWGWVEKQGQLDHTALQRMGRLTIDASMLSQAASEKIASLNAEIEQLNADNLAIEADENEDEEQSEKYAENEERMQEITLEIERVAQEGVEYPAELKAKAGVILAYANGELQIEIGLIRTADRKAVAAISGDKDVVQGGRVTEPAGRKGSDTLSDALRRSLLSHRELAAQVELAKRPDVAKLLLACWSVMQIRCAAGKEQSYKIGHIPTGIGTTRFDTDAAMTNDAGKAACAEFAKLAKSAISHLPKSMPALWDALAVLPASDVDGLIAYAVALSLNLSPSGEGLTGKLLDALQLDMAAHFEPTADNYLGKVSKPLVIEALKEAGKINGNTDALLAMKKGALAAEAEKRLAGTGWVPKLIRAPKPKKPAVEKAAKPAAEAPATAKKKPAVKKAAPAKQTTVKAKKAA